jgi:ribosomal protein S12 methylthiotransferase
MTPRVAKRVAAARRRQLMAAQQPISLALGRALVGREMDVLIEGRRGDDLVARSWRDAPEIDGTVVVRGGAASSPAGSWRQAQVVAAEPYDLVAAPAAP